ncbi:general secretion pathway protein D [marine gamma proteobacterium HTCC2148]|nr:general secretion pathway protein D [marine gamma proteobacterium HTCC2148]
MNILRTTATLLAVFLLVSCTTPVGKDSTAGVDSVESAAEQASLSTSATDLAVSKKEEGSREAVLYQGTDRHVNMPKKREPVRFLGDDVSLNFEQAPLSEVTHAIMGDILELDYVVDHPIQGQVTLRTRTPIPRDQLLGVLESLLKANNTIMIRGSDGRYLVTGSARGTKLSPSVSNPRDNIAGYSTVIVPLQFISAKNMAEILKPVADESAFVRIDSSRNLLVLAGTRTQLDGWLDMVSTFDVDQLKGMSVGLFPLENSEVAEVVDALDAIMGTTQDGSSMKDMIRVVPVDRLNSILIVTPRAHYLGTVEKWIERLDEAHYSALDRRLYVYPVQNTTASRLSDLINSIYSGGQSSGRSQSRGGYRDSSGVAPGLSPETLGSSRGMGSSNRGGSSNRMGSGRSSGNTGSSVANVNMEGVTGSGDETAEVRVVADDENNSLMIYATSMQYKVIKTALDQLDVVATQVIIEASIIEVSLTDELRYGLEWTFSNSLGADYDGSGFLSSIAGAESPASIVPGFSYTVTNSIGNVSAVLNALAEESLLNIISTPSVMVLDNHYAYIHVGQQVPIIDSQTGSLANDTDRVTQSITYRDTGVKLDVRPSVNAGGLITMDVAQSVTDVGEIDAATGQRAFLERNIESRVAVRSNESVVLGGLIRENSGTASQGVPWLHSVPIVGSLFGTDSARSNRTELLVIITPRALYNEDELRSVSEEMRSKIRNLELIDENSF